MMPERIISPKVKAAIYTSHLPRSSGESIRARAHILIKPVIEVMILPANESTNVPVKNFFTEIHLNIRTLAT
jgi:hypothetical protein